MSEVVSELRSIYGELQSCVESFNKPEILDPLNALEESANEVGKAWGHSWLGYQSRVYYEKLEPPPPGANFSSEWAFEAIFNQGTRGHWMQFPEDVIETEIERRAGNADTTAAQGAAERGRKIFELRRDDVISILQTANVNNTDSFLEKLRGEAEKLEPVTATQLINHLRPSGQIVTRDMIAVSQGQWTPPHIAVFAKVKSIKWTSTTCEALASIVRRAFSHLERMENRQTKAALIGTNVFIGHGRSKEWKDLKDFISERMRLPWDEFNRKPVAGIPNAVRLSTMLDAAAIAFLVMTAEDEKTDGKIQARMNVVHEAGLFQGRLVPLY